MITADLDRVFCSGANIYMLGLSTHSFKVNFCKFTNETRLYLEDASAQQRPRRRSRACKGTTAGGGYELALACDEIDARRRRQLRGVSFPETPLLAVLPGTGGLTRLVDKRKVRRDRADVFCTTAEGIKGKRAKDWGLVDHVVSRSEVGRGGRRAREGARREADRSRAARRSSCRRSTPKITADAIAYRYVELTFDRAARTATLARARARRGRGPTTLDAPAPSRGALRAFRELDDALLRLRFDYPDIGMVTVRTDGRRRRSCSACDEALAKATTGFAREVRLLQRRVLKRFDNTARSFYAVADRADSCFAGVLLELALGADRFYMLIDGDEKIGVATSVANSGFLTMSTGLSRLDARFYGEPAQRRRRCSRAAPRARSRREEAEQLGLATVAADDIDFEDELRIAIEERASLSPDALTGMEASLRFVGPETLETKIFGRLSAWQNWIFTRANSTGEHGALTLYGQPERPQFQWKRT